MALNIDKIKNLPSPVKIVLAVLPSLIVVILFITLIYLPKNKEIEQLTDTIIKLDTKIVNSEVKVRRLDALKAENERLKVRLAAQQEQLPDEKEVSGLLKQMSGLGVKSGLEILLWRPGSRKINESGLYVEIPVNVEVVSSYHTLGVFFSYISSISRIVNISGINLGGYKLQKDKGQITAKFIATAFAALTEAEKERIKRQKAKKR